MKKLLPIVGIVGVLIVAGLFIERHTIKSMITGNGSQAVTSQPTPETQSGSAMAPSNNIYTTKSDAKKGQYLADFQGMTLYTYDKDTAGVSLSLIHI